MRPDFNQMVQNIYTLSSLTSSLPIIETPDGEFVPLRALCEIVGLRPSAYIGVFCQYLAPDTQRWLLPWDSPTGRRKDWCIERKHLVYWLVNVPSERVPPDRREAVLALQHQSAAVLGDVYMQMQEHYQEARRAVFQMLNLCATVEQELQRYEKMGALVLDQARQQTLAERLAEGRQLVDTLAGAGRKILGGLMAGPIVDGVILNKENVVTDTTSFPLFPVVEDPDPATIETLNRLGKWLPHFKKWWDTQMEGKA